MHMVGSVASNQAAGSTRMMYKKKAWGWICYEKRKGFVPEFMIDSRQNAYICILCLSI